MCVCDNIWAAVDWIFRKLGRMNKYCCFSVALLSCWYILFSIPLSLYLAVLLMWIQRLVRSLMACISKPKQQQENTAVNILESFAAENKYYWNANTRVILLTHLKIIHFYLCTRKCTFSDTLQTPGCDPPGSLLSSHTSYPYILKAL